MTHERGWSAALRPQHVSRVPKYIARIIVHIGTLPYYRFFNFNTLAVFKRLARHGSTPEQAAYAVRLLTQWRERKLQELQFVTFACGALAAAVIGSFSWSFITNALWLTFACWYSSLILSVLGMLLAAQQMAAISCLGSLPPASREPQATEAARRYLKLMIVPEQGEDHIRNPGRPAHGTGTVYRPSWRMTFVWQCPVMFMSYSACFFLLGLALLVITPLTRLRSTGWNSDASVAVFFLALAGVAGVVFMLCSLWVYQDIDKDIDLSLEI